MFFYSDYIRILYLSFAFPIMISCFRNYNYFISFSNRGWSYQQRNRVFLSSSKSSFSGEIQPNLLNFVELKNGNSKVSLLRSLNHKKFRDEYNLTILDGFRHISEAIECDLLPEVVFFSPKAEKSELFLPFISKLKQKGHYNCIQKISDKIYEGLTDTVNGQGVISAFHKPKMKSYFLNPYDKISLPPLVLLLDGISDPGNMGTIIRSAFGLGTNSILSINGCDVWSPKVLRSSMGLPLQMPIAQASWDEVNSTIASINKDFLKQNSIQSKSVEYQILFADNDETAIEYDCIDFLNPTILVIGSEAHGISRQAISTFPNAIKVKIPLVRSYDSLNAAMASSIILSEASKQRRKNSS